jgi:hypothetical protein
MVEYTPRPFDDRASGRLGSSVGLQKGLLVHAHAKTLMTYRHGKLSLESSKLLVHLKKNDSFPPPSPCISVGKDWEMVIRMWQVRIRKTIQA